MTVFHIIAGLLALGAGATAMSASKGSTLHRQAGTIFVYAMMVMSATGTVMAALKPSLISVVAGSLTFYLVCTALFTVRRTVQHSGGCACCASNPMSIPHGPTPHQPTPNGCPKS